MVQLFGRAYTRRELESYVGSLAQVGGIRPIELAAGRERGVRGFVVSTGTGFTFTALADRALDISTAAFRGRSLAYHSPAGQAHPAYYESAGAGWLRTFPGGLVSTCGLAHYGAPCVDAGEALGLHGRVNTLPVEELGYWGEWRADEYWMFLRGTLTEGVIFGNPLRLTRQISARLGGNSLLIEDMVENLGGEPAPHMLLYHCNIGFPLLSPAAQLVANSRRVTPRDAVAAEGLYDFAAFQPPTKGYKEQVFYHEAETDNAGDARVALINPELDGGVGVFLRYHEKTLPYLIQWKQMGFGSYVLGLEPATNYVEGRDVERAAGRLLLLQPGEQRRYRLEIGVLDGAADIAAFTADVRQRE